jgi:Cu-processing system permease protein
MITSRDRRTISLCARQELVMAVRSRWTQAFALVFGGLSLAVALSGYVLSGGGGVQDFARTAVSLVQLVLLLVPLTALTIGVLSLAPERGSAEILYSQPVSRAAIWIGRTAGLFAALAAAQAMGLGASGVVIFWRAGREGIGGYALLFASSLVLTAVFLSIGGWIASGGEGRRARSLALALIVWFAAVILFDVAALGVATLLPSGAASRALILSVIVNPADAVRTGALLGIEGSTAFGAASLAFLRFTRGPLGAGIAIGASLLFWVAVPMALALRRMRRADL